ncbi:hypothetical protein ACFWDG_11270 [Peribacillus sp. NPDC060186]
MLSFENGNLLGATGLSNPMKYYAGLDKLNLSAEPIEGGYILKGVLASVSNLGYHHWFGLIVVVVPCKGLKLTEKVDYLGLNGSASYACSFNDVLITEILLLTTFSIEVIEAWVTPRPRNLVCTKVSASFR